MRGGDCVCLGFVEIWMIMLAPVRTVISNQRCLSKSKSIPTRCTRIRKLLRAAGFWRIGQDMQGAMAPKLAIAMLEYSGRQSSMTRRSGTIPSNSSRRRSCHGSSSGSDSGRGGSCRCRCRCRCRSSFLMSFTFVVVIGYSRLCMSLWIDGVVAKARCWPLAFGLACGTCAIVR